MKKRSMSILINVNGDLDLYKQSLFNSVLLNIETEIVDTTEMLKSSLHVTGICFMPLLLILLIFCSTFTEIRFSFCLTGILVSNMLVFILCTVLISYNNNLMMGLYNHVSDLTPCELYQEAKQLVKEYDGVDYIFDCYVNEYEKCIKFEKLMLCDLKDAEIKIQKDVNKIKITAFDMNNIEQKITLKDVHFATVRDTNELYLVLDTENKGKITAYIDKKIVSK